MRPTTTQTPSRRKTPKAQLYANLARYGIARVVIEYDGCGDSGCIGDITLFGTNDRVMKMPDRKVKYSTESRIYSEKTKRYEPMRRSCTGPLRDAITTWCYDLLEVHFPGWEIDDGSEGTIELNVPLKTGSWEHRTRYLETSSHALEV